VFFFFFLKLNKLFFSFTKKERGNCSQPGGDGWKQGGAFIKKIAEERGVLRFFFFFFF